MTVSVRDVEEIMAMRGITVSYEAIRQWARKFGQQYANQLRQRRPRPGDKWHLDEVTIKINHQKQYVWRAVDQKGIVLDILVQPKRNKKAAKKFFRKLLKGLRYVARVITTNKLKSYGAAKKEIMPGVEHRQSKYLNNPAQKTHISQHGSGNARCADSNHRAKHNGSYLLMVRSVPISVLVGIDSRLSSCLLYTSPSPRD